MQLALITALGVGGATIIGVLIGFLFQKVPHKFNDAILGFAAGIMLAAAVLGLIVPSLEEGNIWITAIGILTGAVFLNFADKVTPHLHHITGVDQETHSESQKHLNRVMLFVLAIAIHNLPEGIAAGVGFGSENMSRVFMLKPADGIEGVKNAILTAVKDAGPNACPPMVIGVGVGGTFEKCAVLAKKALTRAAGEHSEIPYVAEMEEEMLAKINELGIGPGGLGGATTALAVNINTYPTHIAGLPVAINICCHVNRHAVREL